MWVYLCLVTHIGHTKFVLSSTENISEWQILLFNKEQLWKKIFKLHSLMYFQNNVTKWEGKYLPGFVFPASFILSQRLTLELFLSHLSKIIICRDKPMNHFLIHFLAWSSSRSLASLILAATYGDPPRRKRTSDEKNPTFVSCVDNNAKGHRKKKECGLRFCQLKNKLDMTEGTWVHSVTAGAWCHTAPSC